MNKACILLLSWITVTAPLSAQNVTALAWNGRLTYPELPDSNFVYRVEWTSSLLPPVIWHTNWDELALIGSSGKGSNIVSIPMFFRVIPITNEPLNLVSLPGTAHINTIDGDALGSYTNTHDVDLGTAYGAYRYHGGDGTDVCSITSSHTWSVPQAVTSVNVKLSAQSYPHGNYEYRNATMQVSLLLNGVWTQIYNDQFDPNSHGEVFREIALTNSWQNCTGIQAYSYATAYSYEGDRSQEVWARVYEVKAIGKTYNITP